jgi:hypothetical protein
MTKEEKARQLKQTAMDKKSFDPEIPQIQIQTIGQSEVVIRSAITGKVVKQQTISVNEQSMLLNVPELKPGLYIYMLVADGQVVATDKMLILNDVAYE